MHFYIHPPKKIFLKSFNKGKKKKDKVNTSYGFHKIITSIQIRCKILKEKAVKIMHLLEPANRLLGVSYGLCPVWKQFTWETDEPHSWFFCISSVLDPYLWPDEAFLMEAWSIFPTRWCLRIVYLLGISFTFNLFSFLCSSLGKPLIEVP